MLLVLTSITSCDNPGIIEQPPKIDLPTDSSDDDSTDGSDSIGTGGIETDTTTDSTDTTTDSTYTDGPIIAEALTVSGALLLYNADEAKGVSVCGYIVGSINSTSISGATFSAPFRNSNLLLADSPSENDPARCLPVELKTNSTARKMYNLVDNPQMLHQKIILTGSLERYFRVAGLKTAQIPATN